jgi:hypothetical protein
MAPCSCAKADITVKMVVPTPGNLDDTIMTAKLANELHSWNCFFNRPEHYWYLA